MEGELSQLLDVARTPDAAPALAGRRLGHYVLEERIGCGGMGEVWRARDERLGRPNEDTLVMIDVRTATREVVYRSEDGWAPNPSAWSPTGNTILVSLVRAGTAAGADALFSLNDGRMNRIEY